MTGRLARKVAIVTGAGSVGPGWGNGRATAVIFAREGALVLAVDRDAELLRPTIEQIEADGGTVLSHTCDVTGSAAVAGMVEAALAAFGGVDVLVNIASTSGLRWTGSAQVGYAVAKAAVIQLSKVTALPLGFMGDGRDTAHAALFLASDEARFVTGTEIVVDGGMTARCD